MSGKTSRPSRASTKTANKNLKNVKPAIWISLIIVGIAVTATVAVLVDIYGLTIAPQPETPAEPSDVATFSVINGMSFENVSDSFSAKIYLIDEDSDGTWDNSSFEFYKSYIAGTNGTASNVELEFNETLNGILANDYAINFETAMAGYGNFSDFWVYINQPGVYRIKAYCDPDEFYATGQNMSLGTDWKESGEFRLYLQASNYSTAAFFWFWNPEINNLETTYFYMNVTFNAPIDDDTMALERIIQDPVVVEGYPGVNGTIFSQGVNGTYSYIWTFHIVNDYHAYEFSFDNNIANITKIEFYYGDTVVETI